MWRKNLWVLICIVFLLASFTRLNNDPQGVPATVEQKTTAKLEFVLRLDKESYSLDEPILAECTLTNIGRETVLLPDQMVAVIDAFGLPAGGKIYHYLFREPAHQQLAFKNQGYVLYTGDSLLTFRELKPGESLQATFDVRAIYGLREGKYSFYAVYNNGVGPEDGRQPWQGEIESNVIAFSVDAAR